MEKQDSHPPRYQGQSGRSIDPKYIRAVQQIFETDAGRLLKDYLEGVLAAPSWQPGSQMDAVHAAEGQRLLARTILFSMGKTLKDKSNG